MTTQQTITLARRLQGALSQETRILAPLGLIAEDLNEPVSDFLALLFRVGDALQIGQEILGSIHHMQMETNCCGLAT